MPHYVTKQQLSQYVKESQAAGHMTVELAKVVRQMGEGICQRFKYPTESWEDAQSEALIKVGQILFKMRPDENCFSYITTCLKFHFVKYGTAEAKQEKIKASLMNSMRPDRRRGRIERPRNEK